MQNQNGEPLLVPQGEMEEAKKVILAHRGDKVNCPENTLYSFETAIKAGSHGIETDVHLSRDGVVMMSHDATLKRCFGVDKKVADCDYSYLNGLRTIAAPHLPMPSLKETLELICRDDTETWILLDIKMDDDADVLMQAIAKTIESVDTKRSLDSSFWIERIVLGLWTVKYLPLAERYMPHFRVAHIGATVGYAREFLKYEKTAYMNLHWSTLASCCGRKFMKDMRARGVSIWTWTINEEVLMRRSIANPYIDGACTDDPAKFARLKEEYGKTWSEVDWTMGWRLTALFWQAVSIMHRCIRWWRFDRPNGTAFKI